MNARKLDALLRRMPSPPRMTLKAESEFFSNVTRRISAGEDPGRAELLRRARIWWPAGAVLSMLAAWALVVTWPHGGHDSPEDSGADSPAPHRQKQTGGHSGKFASEAVPAGGFSGRETPL